MPTISCELCKVLHFYFNAAGSTTTIPPTTTTRAESTTISTTTPTTTTTAGSTTTIPPTTTTRAESTTISTTTPTTTTTAGSTTTIPPTTTTRAESTTISTTTPTTTTTAGSTTTIPPTTTTTESTTISTTTPTTTTTEGSTTTIPPTTTTTAESTTISTTTPTTTTTEGSTMTIPPTTTTTAESTTISTTTPTTTTTGRPTCNAQTCTYGATCVPLFNDTVCQCPYGFYYSPKSCELGKVFPGQITITNITYDQDMENKESVKYGEVYYSLTSLFHRIFATEKSYRETVIVSLSQPSSTLNRLSKAGAESYITVTLINMFDTNTSITEQTVTDLVQNSSCDGNIQCKSFREATPCDVYGCDKSTTECKDPGNYAFPTCECSEGLAKKNPEDKTCLLCNASCSVESNKRCYVTAEKIPECQCLAGYETQHDKSCKKCNFGYSGVECKNNYLAVLVGVAVSLGVIIIVLTGVLIYKVIRTNKQSPENKHLLINAYETIETASEGNSATNSANNGRIFPRIQIKNPQLMNQEEQQRYSREPGRENRAYLPERDYDDDNSWLEMSSRDRS
uniref:Mucin-13 isoform X2 n=1 Tax=Pogona vitticeps TaxID=103695 RepID=A0ABM5F6S9_9SAUR